MQKILSENPLILEKFKVENELKNLYLSKSRCDKLHIELEKNIIQNFQDNFFIFF